jgi:hypothetical protein
MTAQRASASRIFVWFLAFLTSVTTLLVVLSGAFTSGSSKETLRRAYSKSAVAVIASSICTYNRRLAYEGYDYPSSLLVDLSEDVHLLVDNSIHYNLDGPISDAAWKTVFPPGNPNGIVRLGPKGRAFGVSMFHELKCLDVLRRTLDKAHAKDTAYLAEHRPRIQHCMDYLRHTTLCRADTTLQNLEHETYITESLNTYTCKDWTKVYSSMEENHKAFLSKRVACRSLS